MTAEERKCLIASCRFVDEVIDQSGPTTTKFMRHHGFDVFAYAVATEEENERNHQKFYADLEDKMIVRLPYSPGISTTSLIDRVRQRLREEQSK
jgi:glycerol-3-phosphate cytidylyltransferase-like family protein